MATSAHATAYSDSFVADPASLSCGYFGTNEICSSYSLLPGPYQYNARYLNAGDTIDESVVFETPGGQPARVDVPGSSSQSLFFIGLPDITQIGGDARPGPDEVYGGIRFSGYKGPSNPVELGNGEPYSSSIQSGYILAGGLCCGVPLPEAGFSITGAEITGQIGYSDPYPIYGVTYGYGVVLPATPQLISNIAGGTLGHPAILPAGEVGAITFGLSGQGAEAYYAFDWAGGLFQATGSVASPPQGSSFTYQLDDLASSQIVSTTLNSGDSYTQLLSSCGMNGQCNLAAGEYIIGLTDDGPGDPMATIDFGTPVESTLGVPEPGAWALLLGGLAAIGASMRIRPARRVRS